MIVAAPGNTIGGTAAGARNVISGNGSHGVRIDGSSATGNWVQGNYIGTNAAGTADLGNAYSGVSIGDAADNTVGGMATGAGNVIAYNDSAGASIEDPSATGNGILSNAIFDNGSLGIDLGADGVTPNDPQDPDLGPNLLQNYPLLSWVVSDGVSTTVRGSLNSLPATNSTLQFFSNDACDPSGYGEGQTYLGSNLVTTNVDGDVPILTTLPVAMPPGDFLTATATDPFSNTSEFSPCVEATSPGTLGIGKWVTPADIVYQGEVTYTITVSNTYGTDATGTRLTDTLPTEVDFVRWVVQNGASVDPSGEITWTGTVTHGDACSFVFVARHVGERGDVVVNSANFVHTASGSGGSASAEFSVDPYLFTYLPVLQKGFAYMPDLEILSLTARADFAEVTLKNRGNQATHNDFWVDVYFNPSRKPRINEPWPVLAAHGIAFGVTDSIPAGGTLVVSTTGKYFVANESSPPPWPEGVPVWAYVDSVNFATTWGAVRESDETNNVFGPVESGSAAGQTPLGDGVPSSAGAALPSRR